MKPIIGITPCYGYEDNTYRIHANYIKSITNAGGIPIVLFPSDDFPEFVDGLLLSGGGDVNPLLFGEEPLSQNGEICPLRDAFELHLCDMALKKNLPILGICRGMQILTIVTKGKILQDITAQTQSTLKHMQQGPRFLGTHTVFLEQHSKLHTIFQKNTLVVNSFHHQAIASPGNDCILCAKSQDGLIEAIEHTTKDFVIGVQWHPEAMQTTEQEKLFASFVQAAASH